MPVALNSTAANVTVALVLKVDAAISTSLGPVAANVGAGAHLTLVQIRFGEVSSNNPAQCKIALFADIESNGGAFAEIGASAGDDLSFDEKPAVSTVFATAGTTTCLTNTRPALPATTVPPQTSCPLALVADTTTTTATYSLTSCLVKAIDCPTSLTQVVVVTNVQTLTATRCPASGSGAIFETVPPVTNGLTLPPLQAVTTTVAPLTFNVSRPANATLTGKFQSATGFATIRPTSSGLVQSNAGTPVSDFGSTARMTCLTLLWVTIGVGILL